MKNNPIKRYLTFVLIYSVICILIFFMLDYVFNGMVIDFLFTNLPAETFYSIYSNRYVITLLVYLTGLLSISAIYVIRLGNLIKMASNSISQEQPDIFNKACPSELTVFYEQLKNFKSQNIENERARKAAEQQKNDLIVYLAHDLKTPLTSVIGYISLLDEAEDMPKKQRIKYTKTALNKAYRLEQLINEFFDITRLNLSSVRAEKSKFNITIMLMQIIEEFHPMFEQKNLHIVTQIEPELMINGDSDKIARVIDNLLKNAVNYSYEKTSILCVAQKNDDKIVIKISNTGENIPKEKLDRIFDKFYRCDSSRTSLTGGAGLGLAIAKQIVELHNGSITACCENNITQMTVTLPI